MVQNQESKYTDLFNDDESNLLLQELEFEGKDNEDEYNKKHPSKLEALTRVSWERGMRNYLSQLLSHVAGVPLVYAIRN